MTFRGPDADLMERYSTATQAPVFLSLSFEEQQAMKRRIIACQTWDDVSPEDQALIRAGLQQVHAGLSPTLENVRGNWAEEDAEVYAADEREAKAAPPQEWVGL